MSQLTIKSGKGEVTLRKSPNLVGIKTNDDETLADKDFVKKQVLTNLGGFQVVALEKDGADIDTKLDEVRQSDEVAVGTHVYYPEGSNRPVVATGEIIIVFQEHAGEKEQQVVLDEFHLQLVERRSPLRIIARVTAESPNPFKTAAALQEISLVKMAEPDMDTLLSEYDVVVPADNLFPHQWHLHNEGRVVDANYPLKRGADSKVVDAWNRLGNMGSPDVVVAVIDNGFDLSHPDLKDKIFKPFDLWSQNSNVLQGDPSFTHGTPCASVALAPTNGNGIVGSAPNARFMPLSGTSFSLRATEQMFEYCLLNGADIISCSWGTTDPNFSLNSLKEEVIARAAREGRKGKGCVICYAVGNDDLDYVSYYAAHPDVIAVGACTSQDAYATYSNRGREVTVVAPSNGDWPIIAARAWWDEGLSWETGDFKYWRDGKARGDRYKHFGGTSSACPLVAGICALILSANPDLTAREVKDILIKTADRIGHPSEYDASGHSVRYGYGRVNADKAVAEALRRKDGLQPPKPEIVNAVSSGQGLFRFNVAKQKPEGWAVQVGVYADYGNVLINAERLQSQFGHPVLVSISELNGKTVYKVLLGSFNKKSEADTLFKQLKDAGINGFPKNLADFAPVTA